MLTRTITGVILVACVLALIIYAPLLILLGLVGIALLGVLFEYLRILQVKAFAVYVGWMGLQIVTFITLGMLWRYLYPFVVPILLSLLLLWAICVGQLACYTKLIKTLSKRILWVLQAYFLISGAFFSCMTLLDKTGCKPAFGLLLLLVIVWAQDSGAYFVGSFFGKHKLMPKISPNKTWEGVLGGLLLVWVVSIVVGMTTKFLALDRLLLLSTLVAIASIFGDLFQSMLKRLSGVKDSGQLLPGHGGLFDRLDSLLIALPIFSLGLILLL